MKLKKLILQFLRTTANCKKWRTRYMQDNYKQIWKQKIEIKQKEFFQTRQPEYWGWMKKKESGGRLSMPESNHRSSLHRFHDKVIIEEELNCLRREQSGDWERTRHHLKLARKGTSLESLQADQNSIETFTVLEKNGFPNKVNSLEKMHWWTLYSEWKSDPGLSQPCWDSFVSALLSASMPGSHNLSSLLLLVKLLHPWK